MVYGRRCYVANEVINEEDKDKKPKSERVQVKGKEVLVSSRKIVTFDSTELRTVPRGEIQLHPNKPEIKPPPEYQDSKAEKFLKKISESIEDNNGGI
jgi:hypothetical protein